MALTTFTGSAGTNDGDVIYTSADVSALAYHYVECTAGEVAVEVSLDGTNWITSIAGRAHRAVVGTTLEFVGKFTKLRVKQKGATAANARGAHG